MTQETSEQRLQRLLELRESIVQEMLQKYPNLELDRRQYEIDAISYIPYYQNGIKFSKTKKGIYTKSFSMENKYLTKEDAQKAIEVVIHKAQEKYKAILEAFKLLQSNMDCNISYQLSSNLYLTEDGNLCISFKMDGFDFHFDLTD